MIFQFKKLFLSLIFTVALCCGLSVSAFANENFYYNGVELPPLPSYILENYQYLDITHPTSSYYGLYGRTVPIYCKNGSTSFYAQAPFKVILYEITSPGGNWQLWSERTNSDSAEYSANTQGSYVWSNYDILNIDTGAVAFYGSQPVPVDPPVVPTLSVTATDITSTTADITFDATGLDPSKEYQIRMEAVGDSSISGIIATFSGSETFNETVHTTDLTPDTVYSFKYTLIEDGVDTSAVSTLTYTTLPFVYDPELSVSVFSVTTNTATCQIDMAGFDPSGSYRLYYDLALSEDVGDTSSSISKGYSNQIGTVSGVTNYTGYHRFTDLSPNTEYYVAWTVEDMATGTAVPVVDSVTFTTSDDGSGGGGAGSSDDSSGILLMILNKVTAILDTLNGGQSEGILASINEKLGALIDTLANPEEQKLEDNFKGSLTEVNNNFFGDDAAGQAVTVSDVGNLANAQGTVKTLFQSDYTVSDFFGLFSDNSFFGWFSIETALDLNPSYGSPAVVDLDDPYNMDIYYENLEKVRGKK